VRERPLKFDKTMRREVAESRGPVRTQIERVMAQRAFGKHPRRSGQDLSALSMTLSSAHGDEGGPLLDNEAAWEAMVLKRAQRLRSGHA